MISKDKTFEEFMDFGIAETAFIGDGDVSSFRKEHHRKVDTFKKAYDEAIEKGSQVFKISSIKKLVNGFLVVDLNRYVTWHSCYAISDYVKGTIKK